MIIAETINSFDNEPFWCCLWMGGQKVPLPKNFSHISFNDKTWHSYTLPKKDKKRKLHDATLDFS